MTETNRQRVWIGRPPDHCDICKVPFENVFIDGKTKHGSWGNLCSECHELEGVGFGTGRGQKYELNEFGEWIKTEG